VLSSRSLRDGAGASERLAELTLIGIVARVSRAVAPHEPSARAKHERTCGVRKFGRTSQNIRFAGKTEFTLR
jgi:hypothetical protein